MRLVLDAYHDCAWFVVALLRLGLCLPNLLMEVVCRYVDTISSVQHVRVGLLDMQGCGPSIIVYVEKIDRGLILFQIDQHVDPFRVVVVLSEVLRQHFLPVHL